MVAISSTLLCSVASKRTAAVHTCEHVADLLHQLLLSFERKLSVFDRSSVGAFHRRVVASERHRFILCGEPEERRWKGVGGRGWVEENGRE